MGLRTGIAIGATALMLSPRARRAARKGIVAAGAAAIKMGSAVVRGTRSLQEAEKHVVKFGDEAADEDRTGPATNEPPSPEPRH